MADELDFLQSMGEKLVTSVEQHLSLVTDLERIEPVMREIEELSARCTDLRNRLAVARAGTQTGQAGEGDETDWFGQTRKEIQELGAVWLSILSSATTQTRVVRNRMTSILSSARSKAEQEYLSIEAELRQLQEGKVIEALSSAGSPDSEALAEKENPDEATGEERRLERRREISLDVLVQQREMRIMGITENISSGGMFVVTRNPFELGSMVHVGCQFKGGSTVQAEAVVVWHRDERGGKPGGMGLEFLAMSDSDKKRLIDELTILT